MSQETEYMIADAVFAIGIIAALAYSVYVAIVGM